MPNEYLLRANLRTPKAAAIAGMLFSFLLMAAFSLLRISVPADPQEPGSWLRTNSSSIALAINLVPFAGIAFLWFIGVLRDRLGQLEDRFFATVFFGSGLLFLGMLFTAAATIGAILMAFATQPEELVNSATFHFARATVYNLVNIYMIKMAAVFMITASTLALTTGFAPRWLAIFGYILALLLLIGSYYISWSFVVFPVWVFLISFYILRDNLRRRPQVVLSG
jgi:MFS family permease